MHVDEKYSYLILMLEKHGCHFLSNDQFKIQVKPQEVLNQELFCCSYNQIHSPRKKNATDFSRGFIFDPLLNHIVCMPFTRSYNIEEYPDATDLYLKKPITLELCSKEDGSLMKVYKFKDKWIIASNSTAEATYAGIHEAFSETSEGLSLKELFLNTMYPHLSTTDAYELLQTDMDKLYDYTIEKHFSNYRKESLYALSFNFELCTLKNKVVLDYSTPTLFFLATTALYKETESRTAYLRLINKEDNNLGLNFKTPYYFTTTSQFENLEELLSFIKGKLPAYFNEGFIVYLDSQAFKYKTESYVAKHHLKGNGVLTSEKAVKIYLANEHHEFLGSFPEYQPIFDKVESKLIDLQISLNDFIENSRNTYFDDLKFLDQKVVKKQFAAKYSAHPLFALYLYTTFKDPSTTDVISWLKTVTEKTVLKHLT